MRVRETTWLMLAVLTVGCLTPGTYTEIQQFAIDADPKVEKRPSTDWEIALRNLDYAKPYEQRMVYRNNPYSVAYRPDAKWAEPPRDTVTRLLKDGFAATGFFADVGTASDVNAPQLVLTGELRRFDELRYGDRRALAEIRIEVRSVTERDAVWARTYTHETPMPDASANAFAESMSDALSAIVEQATRDIVDALEEKQTQ